MTLDEWLAASPPEYRSLCGLVTWRNALRELRHSTFQLIGMYDGSASEECKVSFQRNYETLDKMVLDATRQETAKEFNENRE